MGISEPGSAASPWQLLLLWHLSLRFYFWKSDFPHFLSLPPRLWLHFQTWIFPFPIPTPRISAWGCCGFYQWLKLFPGSSCVAQEGAPPLWKLLEISLMLIFCTKQLCCCSSSSFSPLLLRTCFQHRSKDLTRAESSNKIPSPFGVKSMAKPRWS